MCIRDRQLLLQIFLILLNAFFAATEIAVISLNPTKLRKLEEQGERSAKRLLKMVEQPAGFLSTIQIGITPVSYTHLIPLGKLPGKCQKTGRRSNESLVYRQQPHLL